ncbi:MAG: hypothetical protein M5U34_37145 [Chloroflexi bacterium]|nr:hypothetical protein [Chloroflexota bacterium]
MPHNPVHPSSFKIHPSALIPIYQWRGARPPLLDLETDQTGWLICLCLQREGDISLLPLSWQTNAMDEHHTPDPSHLYPTIHTQALDNHTLTTILNQLQREGWHTYGQLTLAFSGQETIPNFHQELQKHLWQTPQSSIKNQKS